MFSRIRRGEFTPQALHDEFDQVEAQISATWLKEHAFDGSHRFPAGEIVPVGGTILWWAATLPSSKWLALEGQQVSRTTYQGLFSMFGTSFGVGDGSTTFNLPDTRQRFVLGQAAAGTGSALGATGGAIDHVHTGASHTHTISSQAAHTHSISSGGSHAHTVDSHGHGISGEALTSGSAQKIGIFGETTVDPGSTNTASTPLHLHEISAHSHGGSTGGSAPGTDSQGSHDHTGATGSNGAHDHGGATGASGTGNTGTANPPFIVARYIIFTGVEVR